MDLPPDVAAMATDPVAAPAPVAASVKAARAQRRRPAMAAMTAVDPSASAPVLDAPAPADAPVSTNPPAAVMAETTVEDNVMDSINTAETFADTTTGVADQMADRGQAAFADMSGRAKDAVEKGNRMVEELNSFGKGNLEAMVESSKIAAKGLETIGQEAAEFTRKSFESATAAMKSLAATRSPTEFMKLQSDYARSMFDSVIAGTSRSTEMMLKLANDVAQPLSNRVAVAADKMKVAA